MAIPDDFERVDILLVDDKPENLIALAAVLESPDYNLIQVNSGQEALRYLLDHDLALILMDVQMPELDGFETASIIKKNERTRQIPIIFITAINSDDSYAHKGYDHGAVDYIYKPYDDHILKSKVAVFVDLYKKTNRLLRAERELRNKEKIEREKKIAELELLNLKRQQKEQKKYRDLVDGINHGIVWSADPDPLIFSLVSKSAKDILGFDLDEWTLQPGFWMKHIHPEDKELFLQTKRRVLETRQNTSLEHRFFRKDGQIAWLHTGIRIEKKSENESELHGLTVDITRSKAIEQTLYRNKRNSDFLAEASLILSGSLEDQITLQKVGELAVPQFSDWYAVDLIDELGKVKLVALVHRDPKKAEILKKIREQHALNMDAPLGIPNVLRTGKSELYTDVDDEVLGKLTWNEQHLEAVKKLSTTSIMIVPLISRGKTIGTLRLASAESACHYQQEDLVLAEGLAYRIALALDNANLYQQAQSAIRLRDEFLTIASHELKTPLTPLKMQTQSLIHFLKMGSSMNIGMDKINKTLEVTDRQITRLTQLVEDLLDVSRISSGKLRLNIEEFSLSQLIHETVDRLLMQPGSSDIEFRTQTDTLVCWDRFRIEQVIINLLTNAIKYGCSKPISVILEENSEIVRISVTDQGIGIAKPDQARIFNRFERAVSSSHFNGLGLGLYIVSQILEAHGGTIHVQSELGLGAKFIVEIPNKISALENLADLSLA